MKSLVNRDEIRRLEKAAREKDKKHLAEWAKRYEQMLLNILRKEYEEIYQDEINTSVNNILLALGYTLLYSEEIQIPKERIPDFIDDLMVTVDMYRTGEYKPQDYQEELKNLGVILDDVDYTRVYKKEKQKLLDLINEYEELIKKQQNNNSDSNQV